MNLHRMLKWQDALINMNPERFNFSTWADFKDGVLCTVCAGGRAAETFEDEGLVIVGVCSRPCITVYYDGEVGSAAIAKFFDISVENAKEICMLDAYKTGPVVRREACIAMIDKIICENLPRDVSVLIAA